MGAKILNIQTPETLFGRPRRDSSSREPVPGQAFKDCVLERVLERGTLGTVWLAWQEGLKRHVQVKVFGKAVSGDSGLLEQGRRMATLDHPGLSDVLHLGQQDGHFFLVREHVQGRRLDQLLGARFVGRPDTLDGSFFRLPSVPSLLAIWGTWEAIVAKWGRDLACGLSHAHRHGILHRALWSGNVLVDREGSARLHDFWLAHDSRPRSLPKLCGYLAPEEEAGDCPDARTDVFGLGVILYECLTGTMPYAVEHGSQEVAVGFGDAPIPLGKVCTNISPQLAATVMRAIQVDPGCRYETMAQMGESFGPTLQRKRPLLASIRKWFSA